MRSSHASKSFAARRTVRVLVAVLSAVALMFTVAPGVARAADTPSVGAGSGLRGSAVLANSGVGSIHVVAYQVTPDGEDWTDGATTQSDGTYDFPSLKAGHYVVRFTRDGYRAQCYGGATCAEIEVFDGQAAVLDPVTLVLTTPGTIKGKVVGGDGKPLAGATVTATNEATTRTIQTDVNGAWSLAGVASEVSWYLTYAKTGLDAYYDWIYPGEGVTTDVGQVMLLAPGSVVGTIRNAAGVGISGADVYLESTGYGSSLHAVTGAGGTYAFTPSPGRYRLYAIATDHPGVYYPGVQNYSDASWISVKERGSVTTDLTLVDAVTLSGLITDTSGTPLQGDVALYRNDGGQVRSYWTGTDGQYTFASLWPGTFTVRARATGHGDTWLGGAATQGGASWVAVTSGTKTLATIALPTRPPITISGTVRDADGNPVPDVTLELGDQEYTALTDANGVFSVTGVEAATYDVAVTASENAVCGGRVASCAPATVTVPIAGSTGVEIGIPRLGSLSGTLTVPDGMTIDWGELILRDANGKAVAYGEFSATAPYSLGRVPFGTYELTAEADGLATFTSQVTVSGATTLDLALITGFSISGVVTVPGGFDSVEVVALDAVTGKRAAYQWVDTEGSASPAYVLSHLPPGDYRVGANWDGSRWEWYTSGSDPRTATVVHLADSTTGIDLTLPAARGLVRISGKLILPTGVTAAQAAGLEVWLEDDARDRYYETVAAADASYFFDVPTGDYRLHVQTSERLMTPEVEEALVVAGPVTHDVRVPLGGMLIGRLVDADGLAVDGLVVAGVSGDLSDDLEGYTNKWGFWTFGPVAPGKIQLTAEADGFVSATAGPYTVVAGQSVDTGVQRLAAAGRLSVHIPDVGSSAVTVLVTDLAGNKLASRSIWPGDTEDIDGLPAGQVLLRFSGSQIVTEWWRDASSAAAATKVTVKANSSAALLTPDLALAAAPALGTISGKITNSTGLVGDLHVGVYGDDVEQIVAVNADGTYSVQVPAGTYQVAASVCAGYWMGDSGCMGERSVLWYPGSNRVNAESIDVTSALTTSNVNIELGGPVSFLTSPKPVVAGTVAVGGTLTVAPGVWVPAADQLAYQWKRSGVAIGSATANTYTLAPADLGQTVTVTVTARAAGRLTTARTSAPTTIVQAGTITAGSVSITGSATVGSTLTAVPGTWSPVGTALAYQWLRNGAKITGATASTYTVQLADATTKLSVTVTGSKVGYTTKAGTSVATAVVSTLALTVAPTPTVSGTVKTGSTLTATPGTWGPAPVTLAYQWLRDGVAISAATRSTYTIVGADVGKALTVRVTGSRAGYTNLARTSAATIRVPVGIMTTVVPAISGTVRVGQSLTATTSGWLPVAVTFSYQWYRSGTAISGATARTYALTSRDLGKTMKVKATGTSLGYATASTTSKSTATVAKGVIVTAKPVITGTVAVGQVLNVPVTAWKPSGLSFAFKWYRSGSAISGASAASYKLTAKDKGKKMTVKVTASKAGFTTVSKTSAATATVVAGTLVAPTPTIAGKAAVGQLLTAQPGSWGPAPVTLTYRWLRAGVAISGATASTYRAVAGDKGKTLTVTVTGKKTGYNTASRTSKATLAVT